MMKSFWAEESVALCLKTIYWMTLWVNSLARTFTSILHEFLKEKRPKKTFWYRAVIMAIIVPIWNHSLQIVWELIIAQCITQLVENWFEFPDISKLASQCQLCWSRFWSAVATFAFNIRNCCSFGDLLSTWFPRRFTQHFHCSSCRMSKVTFCFLAWCYE